MICKVTFNYYNIYANYETYRQNLQRLIDFLDSNHIIHPLHGRGNENDPSKEWSDSARKFCDEPRELDIIDLAKAGVEFNVKKTTDNDTSYIVRVAASLKAISDKLESVKTTTAEHVQIAIHSADSGSFLHKVNRTKVMEDLCTDSLQIELDEGWRILAICPQRNQRRPDYILGKYEPKEEPKPKTLDDGTQLDENGFITHRPPFAVIDSNQKPDSDMPF